VGVDRMSVTGSSSDVAPFIQITPQELNFSPPYDRVISQSLQLRNTSSSMTMAFKVRTTAPKRYMVKPGTGYIPPLSTVEVKVFLNITKDPPKTTEIKSYKDKFQIQEMDLPLLPKDGSEDEKQEIVKNLWATSKDDKGRSQKLKCTFQVEEETKEKPHGSVAGGTSVETLDPIAQRYKAERDQLKAKLEKALKEKTALEQKHPESSGVSFVPILVAFVLGFLIAKLF